MTPEEAIGHGVSIAELRWLERQPALVWGGPIDRGAEHNTDCIFMVHLGLIEKQRRSDGRGGWCNGYVITEKGRDVVRQADAAPKTPDTGK